MAGVRDLMARVDARIYRSRIVRAVMTVGTHQIVGAFFSKPREVALAGGSVQSVGISFECQWDPVLATLQEQDPVSIDDYGTFRYLYPLQPGGDESGHTIIVLGEQVSP